MKYGLAGLLVFACLMAVACSSDATETAPAPTSTAVPTGQPTDAASTPALTTTPTEAPTDAPTSSPSPTSAPAPEPTPTLPPIPGLGGQMIVTDIVNFTLADLTVPVGTTVLWIQLDAASHTTTSGTPGDTTGLWDSGTLSRNQTFTHTFTEEGSFPYFCRIHPGSMQATVEVVADTEGSNTTDVPEPPAASTPTPGATTPPVPTPTSPTLTPAPTPTPQTPPTRTGEPALTPTPTSPPAAESVTLPSSKDNTLYEDAGGALSNGGGDFFFAGKNGQGATRRGVIAFDVAAAVPGGSIVTSASLILNMSRTSGGGGSVSLHRLLADWGEDQLQRRGQRRKGRAGVAGRRHLDSLFLRLGGVGHSRWRLQDRGQRRDQRLRHRRLHLGVDSGPCRRRSSLAGRPRDELWLAHYGERNVPAITNHYRKAVRRLPPDSRENSDEAHPAGADGGVHPRVRSRAGHGPQGRRAIYVPTPAAYTRSGMTMTAARRSSTMARSYSSQSGWSLPEAAR